jgi:hypothetical protein
MYPSISFEESQFLMTRPQSKPQLSTLQRLKLFISAQEALKDQKGIKPIENIEKRSLSSVNFLIALCIFSISEALSRLNHSRKHCDTFEVFYSKQLQTETLGSLQIWVLFKDNYTF